MKNETNSANPIRTKVPVSLRMNHYLNTVERLCFMNNALTQGLFQHIIREIGPSNNVSIVFHPYKETRTFVLWFVRASST